MKILKKLLPCLILSIVPFSHSYAISSEIIPDGAARAFWTYYMDPDITKSGYASVDTGNCSGTMIGPNTMVTAAHCSGPDKTIRFRVYSAETKLPKTESFLCTYITHTFRDGDLSIFDCPANANGENPGDKYGYLDFDIPVDSAFTPDFSDRTSLRVGNELYSFWTNPIDSIGTGNHNLYSTGSIKNNSAILWSNPTKNPDGCGDQFNDRRIGIETDLWAAPRASGSSQVSFKNHRIVLAPLSTAPRTEGPFRGSVSIQDYIYYGKAEPRVGTSLCNPGVRDNVNKTYLSSIGLRNPSKYYGYIDKELDGLIDVQQDIEKLRGESRRDWLWLGFESQRRNHLWSKPSTTKFFNYTPTGFAYLYYSAIPSNLFSTALWHKNLDLELNQNYQISFTVHNYGSQSTHPLKVCFADSIGTTGDLIDTRNCEKIEVLQGNTVHKVVSLKATTNTLRFLKRGNTLLLLSNISIVKQGSVMDFDSHDKRYSWRNPHKNTRGLIVPDGRTELVDSSITDFAGVVFHYPNRSISGESWSLSNSEMAIEGAEEIHQRICLSQRLSSEWPLLQGVKGIIRVSNENGIIPASKTEFSLTNDYSEVCSNWFIMPTDYNHIEFGAKGRQLVRNGAYYIDNIRVEKFPKKYMQNQDNSWDLNFTIK